MASWFSTSPSIPQWKTFITTFQQMKQRQGIKPEQIKYSMQPHQIPSLGNTQQFLSNVSIILNEIKGYNNEVTDFVRGNLPLLLNQAIRMVLEIPEQNESQQRKNRFPLQGLEFIEGLMYLPNIFNINILNQELYSFYCRAIFHYFKLNLQHWQKKRNIEQYQNSLYKNYFFRLFDLPYAVVECQVRGGVGYASMTVSVASSASMVKKQSFLQCLISMLERNPQNLEMMINHISSESLLTCISKIFMTNGMYNYPFQVKQFVLRKLFQIKKKYIEMISNFMNSKIQQKQFNLIKEQMQLHIENILQLQFSIVNRSSNIYDGIKLFEMIGNIDNVKDVVYLLSINIVWTNRSPQNKPLIPTFIEQHLTELLLYIVHKDTILYKSSSPTIELQPKISLKDINMSIQPLLLALKQLMSQKANKVQIKHLNLVKILYVMILNRQKYDILESIVIKQNMLCFLVQVCKKFYANDILVNSIIEIFKSIFKSQVNMLILPPNTPNLQQVKNKNDLIQQKLTAQAFKACDIILGIIKTFKSHKDPLFGHFFRLSKVIKEFARNFFSTIESSLCLDMSSSSSLKIQNSANLSLLLQPLYRNEFIKSKCKEWQDFYMTNFAQLENNYLRELGKFQEFDKAPQPSQTQFTVVKFFQLKQVTNSQVIHDKAEIQATIKNSIQILSLNKQQKQALNTNSEPSQVNSNFKKDKSLKTENLDSKNKIDTIESHLLSKEQIEIASEPIKIEFKMKKSQIVDETDSATEQSVNEEGEDTFKNFMKKKLDEITVQNRENMRKKSKTPTKFKSTDSKTPPKMKKWGSTQPQQKNIPKELLPEKASQKSKPLSLDDKFQRLKQKIQQTKPLPIKIILVGKKVPKVYKERDLDINGRDSRLVQWIRG